MWKVAANESLELPFASAQVLAYICDIHHLGTYEPKISRFRVLTTDAKGGAYRAGGWLLGLPWQATFDYQLTKNGFFSRKVNGAPGVAVVGGFNVTELSQQSCRLSHWEEFTFMPWGAALYLYLSLRLNGLIRRELANISTALTQQSKASDGPDMS